VRHRASGRVYALKAVDKHLVLRHKQAHYIRAERALLDQLAHPGIVRLHFTFQDAASLYLGLELCPKGAAPVRLPALLLCELCRCVRRGHHCCARQQPMLADTRLQVIHSFHLSLLRRRGAVRPDTAQG